MFHQHVPSEDLSLARLLVLSAILLAGCVPSEYRADLNLSEDTTPTAPRILPLDDILVKDDNVLGTDQTVDTALEERNAHLHRRGAALSPLASDTNDIALNKRSEALRLRADALRARQ